MPHKEGLHIESLHGEGRRRLRITGFSVALLLGILLSSALSLGEMDRLGMQRKHFFRIAPMLLLSAYLGARLFYVLFAWEQFAPNIRSIFAVQQGGFALFGALIAILLCLVFYARRSKLRLALLLDAFALPLLAVVAIGRWGDYFSQSGFGGLWPMEGVHVPFLSVYIQRLNEWRLGLFFVESVVCLGIALLLHFRRGCWRQMGDGFFWALSLYGALRTVIESMRQDSLYLGFVRVSQVCAVLLPMGVAAVFLARIQRAGRWQWREWIALVAMAASIALAFVMEFNMGSGREGLYRLGLLTAMVLFCAALAWVYRRTPEEA